MQQDRQQAQVAERAIRKARSGYRLRQPVPVEEDLGGVPFHTDLDALGVRVESLQACEKSGLHSGAVLQIVQYETEIAPVFEQEVVRQVGMLGASQGRVMPKVPVAE